MTAVAHRWHFSDTRRAAVAFLTSDCPAVAAVAIAFSVALAYALILLGPACAVGACPFWDLPSIGDGTLDIRNAIAGYWWFVQDSWHWPLLYVRNANWPEGTSAELFDICPLVAIAGKGLRTSLGWSINPYPWWVTGSFAANGVALAVLARAIGNRTILGAVLAGALGAMAPVVQHRFWLGHMSLLAHWVPMLALALYFKSKPQPLDNRTASGFFGLTLLASFIHLYLYVMTAAIVAAALLQAITDRRASLVRGLVSLVLLPVAGIISLWIFGLLGSGDLASTQGYGYGVYSMNLSSPFWPQTSGLFRWTGIYWLTRGSIGATPGQYDGFDYLGGGALLLIAIATWHNRRNLGGMLRRHIGLVLVLTVLILWAVSDHIYFGPYLVLSYHSPQFLADTVLSWFRGSGRFFWPVGWLLVAIGVARGPPPTRSMAAVMLGGIALLLQWGDVTPWRARFAQLRDAPYVSAFGGREAANAVAQAISATGAVAVVPPVFCSSAGADYASPFNLLALEVEIMAARANARMPTVYLSRHIHCDRPAELGAPSVLVLLKDQGSALRRDVPPVGSRCQDFPIAQVCVIE